MPSTSPFLVLCVHHYFSLPCSNGAVFNPAGMNVEALKAHQSAKGTLLGFPGASKEWQAADATACMEEVSQR